MTTYYVSTKSGNDSNNGTSATSAWSSLSKLTGKLKAGDTVLLERGSDFDQTLTLNKVNGTASAPITFSSYGEGHAPILSSSTSNGITATNSSYIVMQNITIEQTANAGIYASGASNWVLNNVVFDQTGGKGNVGSISWWNSSNVLIQNTTVSNAFGDGIYMSNVNGTTVRDSFFNGVSGANADSIQIQGNNTLLEGNVMVIQEGSNTTKGNVVIMGDNIYAHDNYLEGGSYGMGISGNNVVIANNVMKGHDTYNWSSNIQFSDQKTGDTMTNIVIKDNILSDAYRNITIDGKNTTAANMTVNNLEISGNSLSDWTKAPIVLNGVNVGSGSVINNSSNLAGNVVSAVGSNASKLIAYDNIVLPDLGQIVKAADIIAPVVAPKTITISASGSLYNGGAPVLILLVNGKIVGQQEVTALRSNGEKQTVTFEIPTFYAGDKFAIQYANDKADAKFGDRNLYIHSVSMDGSKLNLKSADLTSKIFHQKDGSGMFFSSNATATFTSDDVPSSVLSKVAPPPEPVWPKLSDVLSNDSHDIYYEGAVHSAGASQGQSSVYGATFSGSLSSAHDEIVTTMANHFG